MNVHYHLPQGILNTEAYFENIHFAGETQDIVKGDYIGVPLSQSVKQTACILRSPTINYVITY